MFNQVIYDDCLNEINGMSTLEDKSIDLGYTDPVWNSDMKPNIRKYHTRILDNDQNKTFFNDKIENFEEWTIKWFNELNRVCKRIVLVIGESNKYWWIRNTDPIGDAPVLWKNGFSGSKIARKSKKSTYLFYGEFKRDNKLQYDYIAKKVYTKRAPYIIPFTLEWGFCSKEKHFAHPSPKGIKIALNVLKQLKPSSLLDPFAGSGSFLYAAHILKIPWLGYEINQIDYQHDIEVKRFGQKGLEVWM